MGNNEIVGIFSLAIVIFVAGYTLGLPSYEIPTEFKNKIEQDAKNNYRSFDEQIGFIISKHYEEVGK
jgi:hypothetical protein